MGRASFKVAKDLIRDLRERQQLTQAEVAARISIHLTRYQNIEWKGTTSPKTAQKLAVLYGVSTGELQQGLELPDPGEYIRRIERIVQERLANGENSNLNKAIQQICAETICLAGAPKISREEATRYLAEDIAHRIEAVQLVRNKNEVAALSELTGLPEEELLRPANAEGIWFVNIHRRENQSEGFNARSEVTQRASWAIGIVKDYLEELKLPDHLRGSDESIRLTQDGLWYRIEIRNQYIQRTIRIDLVRCLPDAKGLRWVKPSWRDEYLICDPLRDWARENFNFVTDFDGIASPAGDIRQLRLLVTEYDQSIQRPTGRIVVSGNLEAMPDEIFESQREVNNSHALVMNWLTVDLKHALTPHLLNHPSACWSLSGSVIILDETKARRRPLSECYFGPKYGIHLVEQLEDGSLRRVPFREIDHKKLNECIHEMLDDPTDPAWATDEPRRSFTPYSADP